VPRRRLKARRDRRDRRGRPRKADAKRRATTLAGRAPNRDEGTTELRRRKKQATARPDLEINAASVLFGRGLLSPEQYDILSTVTLWLQRLARGWGGLGGVTGLWYSITGAAVPTGFVRPQNATVSGLADSARRQLVRALRQLDGSRDLVVALAEGQVPPLIAHVLEVRMTHADEAELARLREGLDRLAGRYRSAGVMSQQCGAEARRHPD
jgi:hypothetical protein